MPDNVSLYILLVVALGIGFWLGRREGKRKRRRLSLTANKNRPQAAVIRDYYQGLNFLLGERPDLGIDRFITAMQVNDESIDVHLALASVVRRRGEVDKAIRLHQNLLAAPVLSSPNQSLVELELARDYVVAGLHDRAEALLSRIAKQKGSQEKAALTLLVDLYEQEKDWSQAIETGLKLGKNNAEVRARLSHFHCQMAEQELAGGDHRGAGRCIARAIEFDPSQARGHWLLAQVEFADKRYKKCLKAITRAAELSPDLVGEYLELYRKACEHLGDEGEYEKFLERCLKQRPDAQVLRALTELWRSRGQKLVLADLLQHVARAPSLSHLSLLLELEQDEEDEQSQQQVWQHIRGIVEQRPSYHCSECGFSSRTLMWHCPTCKAWGSFRAPELGNPVPH